MAKKGPKWHAKLGHNKKDFSLGSYDDEVDAARAFDRAAICARGDAAQLNFPRSDYQAELEHLSTMDLDALAVSLRNAGKEPQTSRYVACERGF